MAFLLSFQTSCGKTGEALSGGGSLGTLENKAGDSSKASSAMGPGLKVKVDGYKANEVVGTAAMEISLYTIPEAIDLSAESAASLLKSVSTQMTVKSPDGKIQKETKNAGRKNWRIKTEQEGKYEISLVATHPLKDVVKRLPKTQFSVYADRTPPKISSSPSVTADFASGEKTVTGQILYSDASPTTCKLWLEGRTGETTKRLDISSPAFVQAPAPSDAGTALSWKYDLKVEKIPADFGSQLLVHADCEDFAKNSSETAFNAAIEPLSFSIAPAIDAKSAPLPSNNDVVVRYVGSKGLKIKNTLLETNTGSILHTSIGETQSPTIKISVSKLSPIQGAAFRAHPETYWFNWKTELETAFPGTFLGRQDIFVGLWRKNADGTDILVNFEKFDTFYDPSPPTFDSWISETLPVVPTVNAEIPLKFDVLISGAKIDPSTLKFQTSIDNKTWIDAVGSEMALNATSGKYEGKLAYPYSDERSFKARVIGEDWAGNSFSSKPSHSLVSTPSFSIQVAQPTRDACGTEMAPKSHLKVQLASSYYCAVVNSSGVETGDIEIPTVFSNAGRALVNLKTEVPTIGLLGFKVTVGAASAYSSFPVEFSNLIKTLAAANDDGLEFPLTMEASTLTETTLVYSFDAEEATPSTNPDLFSTVANSTCYDPAVVRPTLNLRNNSGALIVKKSPFPCD